MDTQDPSSSALLFSEEEMALEKVGSPAFTGASTGERLMSQRPDLYRITVQLLGQGTGVREIKRLTGLHHRTIEAVMIREGSTIDTHRKLLGARALKVAALGVERLEEIIADGSIKPGELSMAVGILIDKGQVLTGGVTARVEKVEQSQVAAGLERMLDDLPVIDAEIVEEVSGINLGGENVDPIAALPAPDPDAWMEQVAQVSEAPAAESVCQIDQAEINIQTPTTDGQSVVSDAVNSVEDPIASNPASVPVKKLTRKPKASKATSLASDTAPASKSKPSRSAEGGRGSRSKPKARNRD